MSRKAMVVLYYTSKQNCRLDCDTLGIDRRRVITLRRGHRCMAGFDEEGEPIFKPAIAALKIDSALIDKVGVESLLHDDDESYS